MGDHIIEPRNWYEENQRYWTNRIMELDQGRYDIDNHDNEQPLSRMELGLMLQQQGVTEPPMRMRREQAEYEQWLEVHYNKDGSIAYMQGTQESINGVYDEEDEPGYETIKYRGK